MLRFPLELPNSLEARDFSEALYGVMVRRKHVGHLLIELSEVILDHAQLFQREL